MGCRSGQGPSPRTYSRRVQHVATTVTRQKHEVGARNCCGSSRSYHSDCLLNRWRFKGSSIPVCFSDEPCLPCSKGFLDVVSKLLPLCTVCLQGHTCFTERPFPTLAALQAAVPLVIVLVPTCALFLSGLGTAPAKARPRVVSSSL